MALVQLSYRAVQPAPSQSWLCQKTCSKKIDYLSEQNVNAFSFNEKR